MTEGDLQAMDRLIKLASELDRYHGSDRGRAGRSGGTARTGGAEAGARGQREGNFPPRKPLRECETRNETRAPSPLARASPRPAAFAAPPAIRAHAWNVKSAWSPPSVATVRFFSVSVSPSAAVMTTLLPTLAAALVSAVKSANSDVASEITSWPAPVS